MQDEENLEDKFSQILNNNEKNKEQNDGEGIKSPIFLGLCKQLKCQKNNKAIDVCVNSKCLSSAAICGEQECQCREITHSECDKFSLKSILKGIQQCKKQVPFQLISVFQKLQGILQSILQTTEKQINLLKARRDTYGLKQNTCLFIKLIKQLNTNEENLNNINQQLNGELILKVKNQVKQKDSITNKYLTLEEVKHEGSQIVSNIVLLLEKLNVLSQPLQTNKIMSSQYQKIISGFFNKKIINFIPLYRASDHQFKTDQFHKRCDNNKNTLVILRTEFDRIIGGFTPCEWNHQGDFKVDQENQSFLYSITTKEKYILKNNGEAIYCDKDYGPTFGGGHDLYICNHANVDNNSYCNFPYSYVSKSQQGKTESLSGSSNNSFKIIDWEVYKIIFST